jgi:mannose-6-phosphate isomerase-like protein (cupin superfamily)
MSIQAFGAGEGSMALHPGGMPGFNVLTSAMTGGTHAVVIADAAVGAAPPYHRHAADETFLILEGTFELVSEGMAIEVSAGGVAYVPGGVAHTIRCVRPGQRGVGKAAVIIAPAGLEGFFDEVERLRGAGERLNPARLAEVAGPYGIEFLGPEPAVTQRRVVGDGRGAGGVAS